MKSASAVESKSSSLRWLTLVIAMTTVLATVLLSMWWKSSDGVADHPQWQPPPHSVRNVWGGGCH